MNSTKFKIESGVQLLARLIKKPEIGNFYPKVFQSGPKPGDIIEVFGDSSLSCFLIDMVCEAILPTQLGGAKAEVLIFNSDGNFSYEYLIDVLKTKISTRLNINSSEKNTVPIYSKTDVEKILNEALANFHALDIYDVTQLYTTIQNLENILMEHSNISLIICDTLTAFYWSEQTFKITKMDLYVKSLLRMFQKVTKEHKITFLYTRPEYFSSNKASIENLEQCCEHPTLEFLNYRIQLSNMNDNKGNHQVNIRTFNMVYKTYFSVVNGEIKWK